MINQASETVVLVSIGFNPVSGRPRLARQDASALALALEAGVEPVILHAGPAAHEAMLRDALGMGGSRVEVLALAPDADPLDPLAERLAALSPKLIVTGSRAEAGEGSGMLPFLLGHRLGRPVIANCVAAGFDDQGRAMATKALPGGARQVYRSGGPLLLTVGVSGPQPRLSAFAKARGAPLDVTAATAPADPRCAHQSSPARPAPRPISAPQAANPADRLRAVLGGGDGGEGGTRIEGVDADASADAILAFLAEAGLIRRPEPEGDQR
jgi:electron transfer flavoprotein beta subunit